jgi:hypothetical protein
MSITVLNQVYMEARRLAVAGSALAHGDFRLKKLLPALDQAGAKAPVFAKVAASARAVIEGPEETSAESLLELASLVTAVLYTQGETGVADPLKPIETVDLGATTQTSARLLKSVLEALGSTGSGRLQLIKDAHERGAFRDLRLVKPVVDALADPYPEIADYLAENAIPLYGKAVLPLLRSAFDPTGGKGDARRLKLLHSLDPTGSREVVKQVLETGSKEVRVAAVECLGGSPEDLSYLVEQSLAKAKEVRAAAYRALAAMDDPAAADVLKAAIAGKDIDLAAAAIARSKNDKLPDLLIAEITKARAAFPKLKDKQEVNDAAGRLCALIAALPSREHPTADKLTLDLFSGRGELAKVKGTDKSGADVIDAVVQRMGHGHRELRAVLARAHRELETSHLSLACVAGQSALPPDEVYDLFSGYLVNAGGKKGKSPEAVNAIVHALGGNLQITWYQQPAEDAPPRDPRWLDLAVQMKDLRLINAVGRPGHAGAEAFLRDEFAGAIKRPPKDPTYLYGVLSVMIRLEHPQAMDALLAAYEKDAAKSSPNTWWYHELIPGLPKSAIPRLEAFVPKLKDREADLCLAAIQKLREKD